MPELLLKRQSVIGFRRSDNSNKIPDNTYCFSNKYTFDWFREIPYFASAMAPHSLHFLSSEVSIHFVMIGFSWVPRSVTWSCSSRIMVGLVWLEALQYQRRRSVTRTISHILRMQWMRWPVASSGRTRSTTRPIVSANLTGLCGVLAENDRRDLQYISPIAWRF